MRTAGATWRGGIRDVHFFPLWSFLSCLNFLQALVAKEEVLFIAGQLTAFSAHERSSSYGGSRIFPVVYSGVMGHASQGDLVNIYTAGTVPMSLGY